MKEKRFGEILTWSFDEDEYNESLLVDCEILVMSSNNNNRQLMASQFIMDEAEDVEDITEQLYDIEDDDTEDEEFLQELLEEAPSYLEEMVRWISRMTRTERQHWDAFVIDMHSFGNALIFLGFNPTDVATYLGEVGRGTG